METAATPPTPPPTPPVAPLLPPAAGTPPLPAEDAVAAEILPYETPAAGRGTWTAGTLSYTRGGLVLLFFWLLGGDFSWQFRERAISPAMPLLLRKFGASDFVASLLLGFMPPLLAIALAPVVSYRSDRHRGRFGRRIPFLLLSTPPAFCAMVGLAFSPVIGRAIDAALGPGRSPGQSACVLGTFALFWFMFDVAVIVTNSVHGALVNDVVPREVIGRFFGCFRVVSLGAGMLFNFFLLGKMEAHYVAILLSIGAVYLVGFTTMCLMVKEGEYPPPPPPAVGGPFARVFGAVRSYFRDCFTQPYYLWFFLSFFIAHVAFTPINLFSLYFAQSVGMSMTTYGFYSGVQLGLSLLQAPLIGWLADKFHPLRVTIVALFLYGTATMIAFLYVRDARSFAAAHVLCGTISGIWLTATAPLGPALLPKLKYATFASVVGVAGSVAALVTAPIVGAWLDHLNHGKAATARDYHPIFLWASLFIFGSMIVTLVVHRYFMAYGGPRGYVPPEPDDAAAGHAFAVVAGGAARPPGDR